MRIARSRNRGRVDVHAPATVSALLYSSPNVSDATVPLDIGIFGRFETTVNAANPVNTATAAPPTPTAQSPASPDPWSFGRFAALLGLYCAVHFVLRLSLSDTIGVDDAIEGVFTQSMAPGYDPRQPPLYTWLLWLVQRVTGPSLISFLILKYGLLSATFLLYYRIAQRLLGDTRYAALTAWSLLLLYQVGWNLHEGVTQTQVLMLACTATLYTFLRASECGTATNYGLLGLAVGAGLLAKLSFSAFLGCIAVGTLLTPRFRPALLSPRLLISLVVAAVVVSPYAWWLFAGGTDLDSVFRSAVGNSNDTGYLPRVGKGLLSALLTSLGFLSPLLPILLLLFPSGLRRNAAPPEVDSDAKRLIGIMLLSGLTLLVLGVLVAGVGEYKERWLHPFLLVAPLYFFCRVRGANPTPGRIRLYLIILIGISAVVVGLRTAHLVIGPPLCNKCRPLVPYAKLADALAEAGYTAGTIVVRNGNTAGNLRAAFPKARIYVLNNPTYEPPAAPSGPGRRCLVVWPMKRDQDGFPKDAGKYLALSPADLRALPIKRADIPWGHLWRPADHRVSTWGYVLFDGPRGRCA